MFTKIEGIWEMISRFKLICEINRILRKAAVFQDFRLYGLLSLQSRRWTQMSTARFTIKIVNVILVTIRNKLANLINYNARANKSTITFYY